MLNVLRVAALLLSLLLSLPSSRASTQEWLAPIPSDDFVYRELESASILDTFDVTVERTLRFINHKLRLAEHGFNPKENLSLAEQKLLELEALEEIPETLVSSLYLLRGNYLFAEQKYQEALDYYLKIRDDTNRDIHFDAYYSYRLSLVLSHLNKLVEAKYHVNQAIEYFTKSKNKNGYVLSLMNRGMMHIMSDELEKGFNDLSLAHKIAEREESKLLQGYVHRALANYYLRTEQLDTAIEYFEKTLKLLHRRNESLRHKTYFQLGMSYYYAGDYSMAISYYRRAKVFFESHSDEMVANVNGNLGVIFQEMGNYEKALQLYFDTYRWAEKNQRRHAAGALLNNIANIYIELENYDKALNFYEKSLDLKRGIEDKLGSIDILVNLGDLHVKLDQAQEASGFYQEALEEARKSAYTSGMVHALRGIAKVNIASDNLESAKGFYYEALDLLENTKSKSTHFIVHEGLGELLASMRYSLEAEKHLNKALVLAENTTRKEHLHRILEKLANFYADMGKDRLAFDFLQRLYQLKEEFHEKNFSRQVANLRMQFELDSKEKEIDLLNKENLLKSMKLETKISQQKVVIVITVAIALLVLIVFSRYRNSKKLNSQLQVLNKKLQELSYLDPLTRVYNRRFLERFWAEQKTFFINSASTIKMGIFVIDIDHFKKINDSDGHQVGDAVLKELAIRLQKLVRESDPVIRWGGEEFLIVTSDMDGAGGERFAQRILDVIRSTPFVVGASKNWVTCSLGYCIFPANNLDELKNTWKEKLELADKELYRAKELGRDRACGISLGHTPRLSVAHNKDESYRATNERVASG